MSTHQGAGHGCRERVYEDATKTTDVNAFQMFTALGFTLYLVHDFLTQVVYNTMHQLKEDYRVAHELHTHAVRRSCAHLGQKKRERARRFAGLPTRAPVVCASVSLQKRAHAREHLAGQSWSAGEVCVWE